MDKKYLEFTATNESGLYGHVTIDGGISLPLAPPLKADETHTNPEQLIAMAWATCLNSTLKFLLTQDKIQTQTRVKVRVELMLDVDLKAYYFKLTAFVSAKDLSLDTTKHYMMRSHERCPISKLISKSNTVFLEALPYE